MSLVIPAPGRHESGMMFRPLALFLFALAMVSPAAGALPPPPPETIGRLLGQYGTADNVLTVYEADGRLFADAPTLRRSPMACTGSACAVEYRGGQLVPLRFKIRRGVAVEAVLMDQRLPRHDFGAEAVATIQAKVKADPARVRAGALAASPPV